MLSTALRRSQKLERFVSSAWVKILPPPFTTPSAVEVRVVKIELRATDALNSSRTQSTPRIYCAKSNPNTSRKDGVVRRRGAGKVGRWRCSCCCCCCFFWCYCGFGGGGWLLQLLLLLGEGECVQQNLLTLVLEVFWGHCRGQRGVDQSHKCLDILYIDAAIVVAIEAVN